MRFAFLFLFFVFAIISVHFFQPVDLTVLDLGRHLKNGELVFNHPALLRTNFYSFTMPDAEFINHHWLSGVLFYWIDRMTGIAGLQVFYAGIIFAGISLLFFTLRRRSSFVVSSAVLLSSLPLIMNRSEIRPEGFGFVGLAFMIWLTDRMKGKDFSTLKVIVLSVLLALWTNLHISFVFGLFVLGTHVLDRIIQQRIWVQPRTMFRQALHVVLPVVAAFCTPFGIAGAFEPFTIFQNYGYDIVENKSPWFLRDILGGVVIPTFFVLFGVVIIALCIQLLRIKKITAGEVLRVVAGLILGWTALRNLPIFALLCMPFLAETLDTLFRRATSSFQQNVTMLIGIWSTVVYVLLLGSSLVGIYHQNKRLDTLRLGYVEHMFVAGEVVRSLPLREDAQIFNNYDLGSYLIYTLYPHHQVFVDNRPEAYTVSFFKERYIPMQENDEIWHEEMNREHLDAIVFGHRDITPWAVEFMARRLEDPDWQVVYVDARVIVFLRKLPEYESYLKEHMLPPDKLPRVVPL